MQSGLPDVSQMMNPEAMLVTSVAVACLGLTVMLLRRPREEQFVAATAETTAPDQELKGAEMAPAEQTDVLMASAAAKMDWATESSLEPAKSSVNAPMTASPAVDTSSSYDEKPLSLSEAMPAEEKVSEMQGVTGARGGAPLGASALIAKVASLLPPGVPKERAGKDSPAKAIRGAGSFQPGGRFSRSQQAFLRIPVVLTGRDESGKEFQEEACTLILLPQGAVIPMRNRVRAGERLMLNNPARQKEVACEVFGAQPGQDGKLLVEVEFPESQKSMWPVSFPAWAGSDARKTVASKRESKHEASPTAALKSPEA